MADKNTANPLMQVICIKYFDEQEDDPRKTGRLIVDLLPWYSWVRLFKAAVFGWNYRPKCT